MVSKSTLYSAIIIGINNYIKIRGGIESWKKIEWFDVISEHLRGYSEGSVWSAGCELLCRTEDAANALADMLEQLYASQGEEVIVNTGYYDPEEDKRNDEEDRYPGWWYVNIT